MYYFSKLMSIISHQQILLRYADQLGIGDEVLVPRNDKLTSVNVISVSDLTMQGSH